MNFLNKLMLSLVLSGFFVGVRANVFTNTKERFNKVVANLDNELRCGDFVKKYGLDKKVIGRWNIAQSALIGTAATTGAVLGVVVKNKSNHFFNIYFEKVAGGLGF